MSTFDHSPNVFPTHVCPRCGEWWDVEPGGQDVWFVSAHDNGLSLCAMTWTEATCEPLCPMDTTTLHYFRIIDG